VADPRDRHRVHDRHAGGALRKRLASRLHDHQKGVPSIVMRPTLLAAALLAAAGWLPAEPADAGGARASAHVVFYANTANTVPGSVSVPNLPRVRPYRVVMFEDGSWIIDKLHWSSWGGPVARATGISSASNCKPNCAEGKRTHNPVRFVVSHPRHLFGRTVYACFQLTDPKAPQSNQHQCLKRLRANVYAYTAVAGSPLHLTEFLSPDRTIWCLFSNVPGSRQAYCGYNDSLSAPSQEYAATLDPSGQLSTCAWQRGQNPLASCVQNWNKSATVLRSGQVDAIYQYRCTAVTRTTVTCKVATGTGKGKGFTISATGVTPIP
jgi:hypothetical protein